MRLAGFIIACLWCTPLYAASQQSIDDDLAYRITFGRADDVKIMLDKGGNSNASNPQGDTMLILAIARNDAESALIVQLLLDRGADPNLPDQKKNYPLLLAAQDGSAASVSALLAKGADIHVRTPSGASITDIAKISGNQEVMALIKAAVDKEDTYMASLHSAARFKEIVRLYGFYSCTYQYWNYYKTSRQNPADDDATDKRIAASTATLAQLYHQIQKYYPSVSNANIQGVSNSTSQDIFNELDAMVSNRNRAQKGVGSEADAKRRCQTISSNFTVNFVPQDLQQ